MFLVLTLYSLNSPWTELRFTGFQWMFALVLPTFNTRSSEGESAGSENRTISPICLFRSLFLETRKVFTKIIIIFLIYLLHFLFILTVLSRISDDNVRLGSWSQLIPGLDFYLVRHICFSVTNNVFVLRRGHVGPVVPGVFPSPPHVVLQVWAVFLQIAQRLEKQIKLQVQAAGLTIWNVLMWHKTENKEKSEGICKELNNNNKAKSLKGCAKRLRI